MPRLRRVDCSEPGLRRVRAGRGFRYVDHDGSRIDDQETIARIRALAIPPAWEDVWICSFANGHIQATGTDGRGRLQYRYHDVWRIRRDQEKFDHMTEFAEVLPQLRETVNEHLAADDLSKEHVLAAIARLLDLGFFRIGTEGYAEENQTYGLATMRKTHVTIEESHVVFDYTAKSGKRRVQSIVDPAVLVLVKHLKGRRGGGPELFAYKEGKRWVDIKSHDINTYLCDVTDFACSAKDFRTWNATVLAEIALSVSTNVETKAGRKRAIARAYQEVAHYLGNTPAVARSSYVDPRIVDRFRTGVTIAKVVGRLDSMEESPLSATHGAIEQAVLDLLDDAPPVTLADALAD